MLKIVPVCGGGSDLTVEGSTCGRAGRRLRRINLVFFAGGSDEASVVSLLVVVVRAVVVAAESSAAGDADRLREGEEGANDVRA